MHFAEDMKRRTKQFALRIINLFRHLPKSVEAQIIGKQLLRSATSVGANYRVVCRARSDREFFAKLSIVIEELDESVFWMELLVESKILNKNQLDELLNEGTEILKILVTARKTTRLRSQ